MKPSPPFMDKEHDMTTQVEWANIGWRGAMRDKLFAASRFQNSDPAKIAEELIKSAPQWVHARTKTSIRAAAKSLARRKVERADRKDLYDF